MGKGSVNKRLLKTSKNIDVAISATTRAPREGEVDGKDYYFVSKEEFQKKIDNDEFVEYATVHGNMYGTLISEVNRRIDQGKDIVLEIDVQGGKMIKEKFNKCVSIFILPPSIEELSNRLNFRGTDSKETIEKRMKNAYTELGCFSAYDYCVTNHDIDESAKLIKNIIKCERFKSFRNTDELQTLINGGTI